jgi:hypothetical protein
MSETRYYITYEVHHHPEGLTKQQVMAMGPNVGGTHKFLLWSIMDTPEGGSSQMAVAVDGTKPDAPMLTDEEIFKQWTIMAKNLSERLPAGSRKDLTKMVFETVQKAVLAARSEDHAEST